MQIIETLKYKSEVRFYKYPVNDVLSTVLLIALLAVICKRSWLLWKKMF